MKINRVRIGDNGGGDRGGGLRRRVGVVKIKSIGSRGTGGRRRLFLVSRMVIGVMFVETLHLNRPHDREVIWGDPSITVSTFKHNVLSRLVRWRFVISTPTEVRTKPLPHSWATTALSIIRCTSLRRRGEDAWRYGRHERS